MDQVKITAYTSENDCLTKGMQVAVYLAVRKNGKLSVKDKVANGKITGLSAPVLKDAEPTRKLTLQVEDSNSIEAAKKIQYDFVVPCPGGDTQKPHSTTGKERL